jgi:hypothetical protein
MSNPRRRSLRPFVVGLLCTGLLLLGSGLARADDESIVLDLVRHGETLSNLNGIIDTAPPGAHLDPTGISDANTLAGSIISEFGKNNIAGVFASQEVRAVETAAPLVASLPPTTFYLPELSGLNEIPAGLFEGQPTTSLDGILYLLGPLSWALGLPLVPDLGDPSVNGVTFDEGFSNVVDAIYNGTANATGTPTDVAFSSEGAIAVWTLMNVDNPDFSILLNELVNNHGFLSNGGQVIIEGSPGDWTLVSYDGVAVPQDPGLGTELFVDFRNLIEAPQFAGYDIYEALLTGNSTAIDTALQTGVTQIDSALSQFPVEVFDQLVAAFGGSI